MLIVSQNKEKVYCFGIAFNALGYNATTWEAKKTGEFRHTICISDGCLEEVAEYESKKRCLEVLKDFCEAYKNECRTMEFYDAAAQENRTATYHNNTVFEFPEE